MGEILYLKCSSTKSHYVKSCVHRVHISNFVPLLALAQLIWVFWDIMKYHRARGSPWHAVIPEDTNDHEWHIENPKPHIHIGVWNNSAQLLETRLSKIFKFLLHTLSANHSFWTKITTLQTMYSVTMNKDCTKTFITFKVRYGFVLHKQT